MEENQVPNPEQQNNNVTGKQKTKKKMGPVKGLLLAILIVFLICVLGLLIRMVVAGDGDYFKPIKDIFGIEEKEDKKSSNSSKGGESSVKSASRYALLSSDTEGENVKHYRLTLDMGDFFSKIMEEYSTINDFSDDNDYSYNEDEDEDEEDYYYDSDYSYSEDDYSADSSDDFYSDDTTSSISKFEDMMESAMFMMQMMGDMVDGEMYFDIYFEGNEIVQIVIGYDYAKLAKNIYDYTIEYDEESMEDEGIKSYDDFVEYMNEQISTMLDKDEICKAIMESMDEETKNKLSGMGIKEKDIKEAIDFNCDKGIFEMYINGTTKLKALVSMGLESDSFKEELVALEEGANVTIDEDNIIEASNETDIYSEYGIEFIEVK